MNLQTELSTNQIEKIKKQAKKLLQFAKDNKGTIPITNLAAAQELLSQLNGFQDWHTLTNHKKITKAPLNLNNTIYSEIILNPYKKTDNVVSLFKIDTTQNNIDYLIHQINFYLNTGFHNITINIKSNTYKNLVSNTYDKYIQSLPIDKTIAHSLFKIDLENFESKVLDIYICLSTSKEMDYMHLDLCNFFKKNVYGTFISDINTQFNNNINTQYEVNVKQNSENILLSAQVNFQKDSKKWLSFLNHIIFQETDINIDLYLADNQTNIIVKSESNKTIQYTKNRQKLYSGLYNAVLKAETHTLQSPPLIENNIQSINLENGIPILDYGSNRFNFIPTNVKNGLVFGTAGNGSNFLFQSIIINKVFSHYKQFNELPHLNIITTHHESILNLLNNVFPNHLKDISFTEVKENVNFFIKLDKNDDNTNLIYMMAAQLNCILNVAPFDILNTLIKSIQSAYETVNYDSIPTFSHLIPILESRYELRTHYQNQSIFSYIVSKLNEYKTNSTTSLIKTKINIININKVITPNNNELNSLLFSSVINNCNLNADFIINDFHYFSKTMDSFFCGFYLKGNTTLISQNNFSYELISRSDYYITTQDNGENKHLLFGPRTDGFLINYKIKGKNNKVVNLINNNFHLYHKK